MIPRAVLALDIGGTKLATGVVTAEGVVRGRRVEPTEPAQGWRRIVDRLFEMGWQSIDAADAPPIGAVGIACGGPLDPVAGSVSPLHLPGWVDVPLGPLVADAFGAPFALHNDATAAALGEYRFGAGGTARTLLYLTVSTGIGGGAIVDGEPYVGAAGNGTEFGHLTVIHGGRPCACGRRGCIEAYASGTSIAARARQELTTYPHSRLATLSGITAADVSAAAAAGDPLAVELWNDTVSLLGAAITDLVNVFEPDVFVLGGGVTRAGAMLLDPIRKVVAAEAMPPAAAVVRVELSQLGDAVGLIGAGAIALALLERGG